MSTSTIAKASRVDRAFDRLEAAVERLDAALKAKGSLKNGADNDEALARLRQENADLKDLNRATADRLDVTIKRLDSLLQKK